MIKNNSVNLRSNKGFTMYDLIIAIAIFTLFAGIIGYSLVTTFKMQSDTQVDEVATLYAIQIAEYIDKISFDAVNDDLASSLASELNIPAKYTATLQVSDYKPEGETISYVKEVKINVTYTYANEQRNIYFDRLKMKEI